MFLFTCATTGRPVHGTISLEEESKLKWENWKTMPNVVKENWDNEYYKNLTEEDIRECLNFDDKFEIRLNVKDALANELVFFQDLNKNQKFDAGDNAWQNVTFGQTVSLSLKYNF